MGREDVKPNPRNYCSGRFADWLEVMLTPACNGRCVWCVEKGGWHPAVSVPWGVLASRAINHPATHIILLGGEPTLYPELVRLVKTIGDAKAVYITSNAGRLSPLLAAGGHGRLAGVNLSIHHYCLSQNSKITGIQIDQEELRLGVKYLLEHGVSVRLNCNIIRGQIDSETEAARYLAWAQAMSVEAVRFAELKTEAATFVSLAAIFKGRYGLSEDPYRNGCNQDAVIDGMRVNFRQMCGDESPVRPKYTCRSRHRNQVLYYDGKFYDGWQRKDGSVMKEQVVEKILREVKAGTLDIDVATRLLSEKRDALNTDSTPAAAERPSSYCHY